MEEQTKETDAKKLLFTFIFILLIFLAIGFVAGYFYVRAEYIEYLEGCVRF